MSGATSSSSRPPLVPHVGFVVEQTLGHRTHAGNIAAVLAGQDRVDPEWMPIEWAAIGVGAALPVFNSNWTVRSGLRARSAVARAHRLHALDALFVHTQVPAVLLGGWLDRIPTVISLDATPRQYDELGAIYKHQVGHPTVERIKWSANRRALRRATAIVTWSEWARRGVIDDYGIAPDKVVVVPPGVMVDQWRRDAHGPDPGRPVRILFVGGDLARKGGDLLIGAVATVRDRLGRDGIEVVLDLVTQTPVDPAPGVVVHHGLTPNSAELKALYHQADIFCLPTLGDCLPMVLAEAGAAGLPLVATDVGAIAEIVRPGETGVLVDVGDERQLTDALHQLVLDPSMRARMGANAAVLIGREHDARTNVDRLIDLLVDSAAAAPRRRRAAAPPPPDARPVLTVSGTIDPGLRDEISAGRRPRADFFEIADAMGGALVLDRSEVRRSTGRAGRAVERAIGPDLLMAWRCWRLSRNAPAMVTDGEHIGLPLAALCHLPGRRRIRHVMIVHLMSTPTKARLFRTLRLGRHIDVFVTYSTSQTGYLVEALGVPREAIVQTTFMVDTEFFRPGISAAERDDVICAVGLERRDYATLIAAVRDLDVQVVIAAASPWSTQPDSTGDIELPANVEVVQLDPASLRDLYARSRFLVMPLHDVDFQAGITALLEAMAMERAVLCSRTAGQTDVVVEGVTGAYVPPGDARALREAIVEMLRDPDRTDELGRAGRRWVVEHSDVRTYADKIAALVGTAREPLDGEPAR